MSKAQNKQAASPYATLMSQLGQEGAVTISAPGPSRRLVASMLARLVGRPLEFAGAGEPEGAAADMDDGVSLTTKDADEVRAALSRIAHLVKKEALGGHAGAMDLGASSPLSSTIVLGVLSTMGLSRNGAAILQVAISPGSANEGPKSAHAYTAELRVLPLGDGVDGTEAPVAVPLPSLASAFSRAAVVLEDSCWAIFCHPDSPYCDPAVQWALLEAEASRWSSMNSSALADDIKAAGAVQAITDAVAAMVEHQVTKVHTTHGRKKRKIEDAGAYVPGSAKERAALRKLHVSSEDLSVLELATKLVRLTGEATARETGKAYLAERPDGRSGFVAIWPAAVMMLGNSRWTGSLRANAQNVLRAVKSAAEHQDQAGSPTAVDQDAAAPVTSEEILQAFAPALKTMVGQVEGFLQAAQQCAAGATAIRRAHVLRTKGAAAQEAGLAPEEDDTLLLGLYDPSRAGKFDEALEKSISESLLLELSRLGGSGVAGVGGGVGVGGFGGAAVAQDIMRKSLDEVATGVQAGIVSRLSAAADRSNSYLLTRLVRDLQNSLAGCLAGFTDAMVVLGGGALDTWMVGAVGRAWSEHEGASGSKKTAGKLGYQQRLKQLLAGYRQQSLPFHRAGGRDTDDIDSPEAFIRSFGLKRLEFGEYVTDARRLDLMRRSAASLRDLADALGVSDGELSLGGGLSVALGSRGRGGKNAPKAHYELTNNVVAMTRDGGDGSLAHEFGHALDHRGSLASLASKIGTGELPGDVEEALRVLRRVMLTSTREDFVARREAELTMLREWKKEEHDVYTLRIKLIKEETGPKITEAQKNYDEIFQKRRIEHAESLQSSNSSETSSKGAAAFVVTDYPDLVEARRVKQDLESERRLALLAEEPRRLLINSLARDINDLNGELYGAGKSSPEGFRGLRESRLSRRGRCLPLKALASAADGLPGVYPSRFVDHAAAFDAAEGSAKEPYWASEPELFARAFETYVSGRLRGVGIQNNYLAKEHSLQETPPTTQTAFPTGTERAQIDHAFEDLLAALRRNGHFAKTPG